MVDENEVKRWIARLETEESSWTNYERLAVLYAIRDQQSGSRERALPMAYSAVPAPVSVKTYGDSDFLRAVADGKKTHPDLMDGYQVQKITDAIYRSAQSGRIEVIE